MAAALSAALDRKRLITLTALAALKGRIVTATEGDDGAPLYVVTLAAATYQAHTLDELELVLEGIEQGGRHG